MNSVKTISFEERQGKDETELVEYLLAVSTSLGIGTNGIFGWTINIPTNHRVKCLMRGKKHLVRWEYLTPAQQFKYLRDIYLPLVVKFHCAKAIGVVELTQKGNMHVHLFCQCDTMQNEYDMWSTRKSLLQNDRVMEIAKCNPKSGKILNYVHFLTDWEDWIVYLSKDLSKHEYPLFVIS